VSQEQEFKTPTQETYLETKERSNKVQSESQTELQVQLRVEDEV
jgi:hypothetical protein